jgi:hypothetical protein
VSIDLEAIRARHLRPEQMEHRTFYAGHIVIDLSHLCDEVERLRGEAERDRADVVSFVRGARLDELADSIERGEHRREGKPGPIPSPTSSRVSDAPLTTPTLGR